MATGKTLRTCPNGHRYYKSSDCPTCPICEQEKNPTEGLLSIVAGPARRAMEAAGIHTVQQLAGWTEKDLLKLHGMGPASLPLLREALKKAGLSFRKN